MRRGKRRSGSRIWMFRFERKGALGVGHGDGRFLCVEEVVLMVS